MRNGGSTHVGDDRVTVVAGDKVLYLAGFSIFQLVATNKVGWNIVPRRIRFRGLHFGHGAIGVRLHAIAINLNFSHGAREVCGSLGDELGRCRRQGREKTVQARTN